jgi:hypothetical protein
MNRSLLIILFLFFLGPLKSQVSFQIGYGVGYYTKSLSNLEVYAFDVNKQYPYWSKPMEVSSGFRGFTFDFGMEKGQIRWFMMINHRKAIFKGSGSDNLTGEFEEFQLKFRHNTFSPAGVEYRTKFIGLGVSIFDFGKMKVWKKKTDGDDSYDWRAFYEKQTGMLSSNNVFGSTFMVRIMPMSFVQMKICYFMDWFGLSPYTPGVLTTKDHYYKLNNLQISVTLGLPARDE